VKGKCRKKSFTYFFYWIAPYIQTQRNITREQSLSP